MIVGDLAYVFDGNRGYSEGFRIATLRPVPDANDPDNPRRPGGAVVSAPHRGAHSYPAAEDLATALAQRRGGRWAVVEDFQRGGFLLMTETEALTYAEAEDAEIRFVTGPPVVSGGGASPPTGET